VSLNAPYCGGIIKYLVAVRMTCIVALYTEGTRSAEYSRVDPGICVRGRGRPLSRPVPFPPFPLEVGSPLNQLGGLKERCKLPLAGSGTDPRPKTNLVHSKAVRKPLVAIIGSILKCMFYSCHLSGVPRDGVGPSPKRVGDGSTPFLNPPPVLQVSVYRCVHSHR